MKEPVAFIDIDWSGRIVSIEHQWINRDRTDALLIVFLHEGLGSVSMWKDFPQRLCNALGCRGLVYSRPGYGRSTPRASGEVWEKDFLHRQARQVLPALLASLGIDGVANRLWLLGHSDGGSIALLYAAFHPERTAGIIALAPHTMVEDESISSIEKTRAAYLSGTLQQRLQKYHDSPDSVFWGWNTAWLAPEFKQWSIEEDVGTIRCPVLAVQGLDDPFGTLAQIRGIARQLPQAELFEMSKCGHSPQRDQPERLIAAATRFIENNIKLDNAAEIARDKPARFPTGARDGT